MVLVGFMLESDAAMLDSVKLFTLQLYKICTSALVHTPLNEAAEDKTWFVQVSHAFHKF